MAVIPNRIGRAGAHGAKLEAILDDMADDLAAIRTAVNATNAKLDADAGVTDTNYAALNNAPALKTVKG